jgi:rhodanese-related sulfurtransferase
MKHILTTLLAVLIITVQFANTANAETLEASNFKLIDYAQLKSLIQSKDKNSLSIFDANNSKTRKEKGMIPGAVALSSAGEYGVEKELPPNKAATLVFYCYNPICTASHTAAERATQAGYNNVNVFSGGIVGWIEHGEKTQS